MSRKGLSRDLALRIGLAARALPEMEAATLMGKLVEHFELPLAAKKFSEISAKELRQLLGDAVGEADGASLEKAAGCLRGEEKISPKLPQAEPYQEGDMPNSIRVAVASNGGEMLDGHFASCLSFLIYQVSADEVRLIDSRTTESAREADDKTAALVDMIDDCHVLFVVSVGGPAAAKVVKAGIHPIKRPQNGPAREAVASLQPVLAGSPPPWLAKVLGAPAEERIRFTTGEAA